MIEFDNSYFRNEVRSGFFVPSIMKRAWAAQISILMKLDEICRENNLKYYADFGTLLGAVRHEGFIPWDDDIDVCMSREDFESLRIIMSKNTYEGYLYTSIYTNEFFALQFDRLTNEMVMFGQEATNSRYGFPFIAGVDIFPIDNLPESSEEREMLAQDLLYIKSFEQKYVDDESIEIPERISNLAEQFKIDFTDSTVVNNLRILYDKRSSQYLNCPSDYAVFTPSWMNNTDKCIEKKCFEKIEYLNFENIKMPVPAGYKKMLTVRYGEYSIPVLAPDERHEYPFFRKQEKHFHKLTNISFMELSYKDLEDRKEKEKDIKEKCVGLIDLIKKQIELAISLYSSGNVEECEKMLVSIQDVVIKCGTILENNYHESDITSIIKAFEEYCELVYNAAINCDNTSFPEHLKAVIEKWGVVRETVETLGNIEKPLLVAFVFETKEEWEVYKKLYDEFSNDSRYKCFIIPVPEYYRNYDLEIDENTMEYIGEDLSKECPIVDYKEFDYSSITFDYIIKSNPFDDISFGEVIHPFFYSKELKKYAKKIVHVPTMDIMDFTPEDSRMMYMTKYFIKTPGVVFSDLIFLKSKVLRDRYIEALSEAKKDDWSSKVKTYGNENELKEALLEISKADI